jgi:hypothetical protein
MSKAILRLSFCFFLLAGLAGCGGSASCGSCGGGGSPTIVTYTFTGNNMPVAVATQIGSGAYTQATLASGTLTISIPKGETNYSAAFLCTAEVNPFVNIESINQASTLDGTAFSEACPPNPYLGGLATIQVNAVAIPGAEGISVGNYGGCASCNTLNFDYDMALGTYDVPVVVTGVEGPYIALAATILRDQTIPGALNGGAPVVFQSTDEPVAQTIAYDNVPNGYSLNGRTVVYNTAGGAFVQLELNNLGGSLTQYMAMPSGTYQSGDYYEFIVEADNASDSGSVVVTRYASSAAPQSFTFPAPLSYAGPAPAALPAFNFAYSGFSGMSNISQQAAIYWGVGTWPSEGIAADLDSITMTATANYRNGSTAMTIPNLSSLTGFLANPPSGTTVSWTAAFNQGDPFLTNPPSGTAQEVSNFGSFTVP